MIPTTPPGPISGARRRLEDDLATLDAALARFATATQHKSTWGIAATLAAKGIVLVRLGRYEEGLSVCDDVVRRYGDQSDPPTLVLVAGAMLQRAIVLTALGRHAESEACLDGLLARFGSAAGGPDLEELVAAARRLRTPDD